MIEKRMNKKVIRKFTRCCERICVLFVMFIKTICNVHDVPSECAIGVSSAQNTNMPSVQTRLDSATTRAKNR